MKNYNSRGLIPFWGQDLPLFTPLTKDVAADVCIIGAGITGLTAAYLLSKQGKQVVLVDDGPVAGGDTVRTTAHLTAVLDERYWALEKKIGRENAKLAAESHCAAIQFIEEIVVKENIDCQFERVDAYLFNSKQGCENLEKELEAARRAGISDVEMLSNSPIRSFDAGQTLKFANQAQFHPIAYIKKLCDLIVQNRGRIFTKTHIEEIHECTPTHMTTLQNHSIHAKDVIVATYSPVNSRLFPHLKQASYRSYVISGQIPRGSLAKALYYDTLDPYHYIRLAEGNGQYDDLIVGGEDHRTGECENYEQIFKKLEQWTISHFPEFEIVNRWSGQIIEPVDNLAFIGRANKKEHVYIATGYSGNGITYGTIAGILLSDLILGNQNPWEKLYDPHRKTIAAAYEFSKENFNTAIQYADWISKGEIASADAVKKNSGAILRRGLQKIAVYRDAENELHQFSAICPHLGGIVRWNEIEKSWDCPCHGSRFSADGKVVNGPANQDLFSSE